MCVYNELDPRTETSLKRFAPASGLEVEWVTTSGSPQAYGAELEKRWGGGEDLIVVEHDKEIYSDTLPSLMSCGWLWCGYAYWVGPAPHTALALGGFGVTKFSAEVQQLVPVSKFAGPDWHGIDRRFYDYLLQHLGTVCHLHGQVTHHHVYEPRPAVLHRYIAILRAQGVIGPAQAPAVSDPGLLPGSYRLSG
jgi:hypothetical protein